MKVAGKSDGVLVLRGQRWFVFALLIVALCATPLFVWFIIQIEQWNALPIALLVPGLAALAYWRQYKNWQLVLEADYGIGTLYTGRWLNRQTPFQFDLANLEKAKAISKNITVQLDKWREESVSEHYLALEFTGQHAPLTVGIGRYPDVRKMESEINGWLDRYRAQFPSEIAMAS